METNRGVKRWQDLGNLLIGAWLFISPWVMQYPTDVPAAARNAYLLGAAIVIFAAIAMYMPRAWEEGINVLLGLWMIASPWALRFSYHRDATTHAVIIGILVVVLAAWAMMRDRDFAKSRDERHVSP